MSRISEYIIQQGDTLHYIAQKLLGDASKAFEIAIANKLDYPFIAEISESSNVKTPGDKIIIPHTEQAFMMSRDELEIQMFGSDLILDPMDENMSNSAGGQFKVDNHADLGTTTGPSCASQDLLHRLVTPIGSLLYHPNYGSHLPSMIGTKGDYTWKIKAMLEVERCLRCDDRVLGVKSIKITDVPTGIHLYCVVITHNLEIILSKNIGGE